MKKRKNPEKSGTPAPAGITLPSHLQKDGVRIEIWGSVLPEPNAKRIETNVILTLPVLRTLAEYIRRIREGLSGAAESGDRGAARRDGSVESSIGKRRGRGLAREER